MRHIDAQRVGVHAHFGMGMLPEKMRALSADSPITQGGTLCTDGHNADMFGHGSCTLCAVRCTLCTA